MYFWVLLDQHFFMCFCVSVTSQLASLANCRLHSVDFTATVSIQLNQAANHKFNLRLLPVSCLYGAAALPLCFEVLSCCFLPQMTLICLETADIEEGKFAVDLEKIKSSVDYLWCSYNLQICVEIVWMGSFCLVSWLGMLHLEACQGFEWQLWQERCIVGI